MLAALQVVLVGLSPPSLTLDLVLLGALSVLGRFKSVNVLSRPGNGILT
jgi:hypothetical protein